MGAQFAWLAVSRLRDLEDGTGATFWFWGGGTDLHGRTTGVSGGRRSGGQRATVMAWQQKKGLRMRAVMVTAGQSRVEQCRNGACDCL